MPMDRDELAVAIAEALRPLVEGYAVVVVYAPSAGGEVTAFSNLESSHDEVVLLRAGIETIEDTECTTAKLVSEMGSGKLN